MVATQARETESTRTASARLAGVTPTHHGPTWKATRAPSPPAGTPMTAMVRTPMAMNPMGRRTKYQKAPRGIPASTVTSSVARSRPRRHTRGEPETRQIVTTTHGEEDLLRRVGPAQAVGVGVGVDREGVHVPTMVGVPSIVGTPLPRYAWGAGPDGPAVPTVPPAAAALPAGCAFP